MKLQYSDKRWFQASVPLFRVWEKKATVLMLLWSLNILNVSHLSLVRRKMIQVIQMIQMIQIIKIIQMIQYSLEYARNGWTRLE